MRANNVSLPAVGRWAQAARVAAILATIGLSGCAPAQFGGWGGFRHLSERECLVRAMYFESNRSSDEGLLAVGTVVMNRLESGRYARTICGVVGQRGQFASGVLDQPMSGREAYRVGQIADAILAGQRHPGVRGAMFFHTAGLWFPYRNMHYVLVAGGNAFYEKVRPGAAFPPPASMAWVTDPTRIADSDRIGLFLSTGQGLY